jgi:hypothetical protein
MLIISCIDDGDLITRCSRKERKQQHKPLELLHHSSNRFQYLWPGAIPHFRGILQQHFYGYISFNPPFW